MRDYKIGLELTGAMTQVPDSQKLFGALVYLFAERYGDESAAKLTKAVKDKDVYLALSNVMPEGYLPTPQDYLIDHISQKSDEKLDLKKKRAAIKIRSYIKPEALGQALHTPEKCDEPTYPYVRQQDFQQLRASLDSARYDIPELDTRLYSVPTVVLSEVWENQEGGKRIEFVKTYSFYLRVDDSGLCRDFLSMLNLATVEKQVVILGKRASQGLNLFKFTTITELKEVNHTGGTFLNTGMLLPDRIDFKSSSLKLFTSERRPFEMSGGWNEGSPKYYISFVAQGSIIKLPEGLGHEGKSIESPFRKNRDIVFGNAYLYPVFTDGKEA